MNLHKHLCFSYPAPTACQMLKRVNPMPLTVKISLQPKFRCGIKKGAWKEKKSMGRDGTSWVTGSSPSQSQETTLCYPNLSDCVTIF